MSRPWLFTVSPHGVDVTAHARVSLVYKREVLQALWRALHNHVELSIGDLADIGPQFAHINDIIVVCHLNITVMQGVSQALHTPVTLSGHACQPNVGTTDKAP